MPFWHVKKQPKYPTHTKIHTKLLFYTFSSIFITSILLDNLIPTTLIDSISSTNTTQIRIYRKLWSQQQTNPQEH